MKDQLFQPYEEQDEKKVKNKGLLVVLLSLKLLFNQKLRINLSYIEFRVNFLSKDFARQ